MKSPRRTLLVIAVVSLGLAGCTSSVQLSLAAPTSPMRASASGGVPLILAPTVDLRPDYQRTNAGTVGGRTLEAKDVTSWIDRSLRTLRGTRFVVADKPNSASAWSVTPRLRQCYASTLAVSKNVQIVMELEIKPPDGAAITHTYRGQLNAVNWWNTGAEMEGAVSVALEDCLHRISADLDQVIGTSASP